MKFGNSSWQLVVITVLFLTISHPEAGAAVVRDDQPSPALEFSSGEKVAFVGNSLAERMGLFGHFEALLHTRFPRHQLVIRNFGRPAEGVDVQQRSNDYTKIDDPQAVFSAETYFCFFGFNESFAGAEGLDKFKKDYHRYLDQTIRKYPSPSGKGLRFILVSPIAFEASQASQLPQGVAENQNLSSYTQAVRQVAEERGCLFVDLFAPTLSLFAANKDLPYTINGCHLNQLGDQVVSEILSEKLFGTHAHSLSTDQFELLRQAVVDKSWVHMQDYRKVNGWYVYGGRRTWDTETFPLEYQKIRNMVAVRDQEVWGLANGEKSEYSPDDSNTGELHVPQTRFGHQSQRYSEAEQLEILSPEEFIKRTEVPPGFEIRLFADESRFPELANPVQLQFDNRGRLWVSCMPTYPQWKPGEPKPNDRLLILEDLDGDGVADSCKVFYDKLHCPTGFEFWNGGVLVVDQPRILFLKDTTGDDQADLVVHVLDGWATDDTHHTSSTFQWNHGGYLHLLEGIATSTTLETPWGAHRSKGPGGAYVIDPKTWKIRQFSLPGQYNMWCYSFDQWGQGFPGDGTTCNQAWDTPLSGAPFAGRKGIRFIFDNQGMRPGIGSEFLVSRHFPDEIQGQFTYACVINMNGLPRFSLGDEGGGFQGARLKKPDGKPDDLIRSNDKHFRPADPQIGPDGALWFLDWSNALVGHMQYSQRDPNRDKSHGRVYRLTYPSRPLVEPEIQYGKSELELLQQLQAYEWRTRYRARRELRDRPWPAVQDAVTEWISQLDQQDPEYDRYLCEVLWVQQSHRAVDPQLLQQVALDAKRFEARSAAVHIAADERESFSAAEKLLIAASRDQHPRVRTEAARGLSFFPTIEAMKATFDMLQQPDDYWCDYTIYHTLGANQAVWQSEYLAGRLPTSARGDAMVAELAAATELDKAAIGHIVAAHRSEATLEERNKAMTALADLSGNAQQGKEIFQRNCAACHLVGNEGRDFGPNLTDVGLRLSRFKIIESIVLPNFEVDEKYRTTMILTVDGEVISGLLVKETSNEIEIYDGKDLRTIDVEDVEERSVKAQSSMPDDLAVAMSPAEFIHLIEYLSEQKSSVPTPLDGEN